jgi:uncharacterized protein (DUF305 family)
MTARRVLALGLVVGAVVAAFALGRVTHDDPEPPVGPSATDVGFAQDMSVHHQQAVLMSTIAATRAGPAVKAMAASILTSQSSEIGTMRGWLQLWGEPLTASTPMAWMHDDMGAMHHDTAMAMPGLASPEQVEELWGLSGRAFDARFMQLMTRHHQGGVQMAQYATEHARLRAVREVARVMVIDQTQEINQMNALMRSEDVEPLPSP